jgi:peptidoglycan/LPS O-acetylase OafA/YrhL
VTLTRAESGRFTTLDGLRGVAALIVVFHHISRVIPSISQVYVTPSDLPPTGSALWWAAYTPLKIFTAGPEAVLVFFVLSGFVLALTPLRRPDFDWVGYYPRRVVRLFVPVIAAILFAATLALLVPRDHSLVHGPWLEALFTPGVSAGAILSDSTILFGAPFLINGVLWSLVWEVWFSLLLPAFVALVLTFRRAWWIGVVVGVVACYAGALRSEEWLIFMPVFLIGVALARGRDDLEALATRIAAHRWGTALWTLLLVGSLLLIVSGWMLRDAFPDDRLITALARPLAALGAGLLTVCCAFWTRIQGFFTSGPITWLGTTSFSLYLVHLPIILAVAYVVGDAHWVLVGVISLPVSLIIAHLFHRWVESPAQRLSHAARGWTRPASHPVPTDARK